MEKKTPNRAEIEEKYKWAIQDLYQTDQDWEKEFRYVNSLLLQIKEYKGLLGESASTLYHFMKLYEKTGQSLERVYVYANQKYHEDTTNSKYQQYSDRSTSLMVDYNKATSFFTPEILSIPENKLLEFLEEDTLTIYKRYIFEILRKKAHILSPDMENLLASVGEISDAPDTIFSMFNNADIKFPSIQDEEGNKVEISHARFMTFLQSKDGKVRKEAFQSVYSIYKQFKNTLAATFSANVKKELFYAKARNYDSSLSMALDHSSIPMPVYTNLIEVVHNHLPLMHRYISLRKSILNLEELHMYDLYVPMISDIDFKISFEEAKEKVLQGLSPLGEEYLSVLKEAYRDKWIDVYENVGKRSGAYSWGAYGTHPYVLLNYQENLNNVFTLAHEMGHAIHSFYSDQSQPYLYAGYKIFVAEVASTCNEALLMHDLLSKTEDKQEKAYLLNYYLEQFRTTLYRQTMFAEFEMITHKKTQDGEVLTSENLCQVYHDLNVKYFGESIIIDEEIDMEWSRIPHFYNSFYVYQYATGYSAAIALSRKILKEGKSAVEDYINEFLKGGSSKDPIDLLRGAGVDMNTKEPIEAALKVFGEILEEMEQLLV